MCGLLFAFSQTLLSCVQEKVSIARKCDNYTLYTGQPIWHREEVTKNDNRNMTYKRQYSL